MLHERYYDIKDKQEQIITAPNIQTKTYNGLFEKYMNPVLMRQHIPIEWRYDLNRETNPYFMERLGANAIIDAGAVFLNGKYCIAARIEGNDRKSFFGIAESENGIDHFRFKGKPMYWECLNENEASIYGMRLTQHEDGSIYGVYCYEAENASDDIKIAILKSNDLINWERLPDIKPLGSEKYVIASLHSEFVDGKYAFYITTRSALNQYKTEIQFGLCESIDSAEIINKKQIKISICEASIILGAAPIKTPKCWLHIANAIRSNKSGSTLYAFATAIDDPTKIIAAPEGHFIAPHGSERTGDTYNSLLSNGVAVNNSNHIFVYYSSGGARIHVATTTVDRLTDFVFNTPQQKQSSLDCAKQRLDLFESNTSVLSGK